MNDAAQPTPRERRIDPEAISRTLAFAGLLQMVNQYISEFVVDRIQEEFGGVKTGWKKRDWSHIAEGKTRWKQEVLADAEESEFSGSIRWLVEHGALSSEQAASLGRIRDHRNDLTHEMR